MKKIAKKSFFRPFYVFVSLWFALTACSKPETIQAHLSNESIAVFRLNTKQLATKVIWEKLGELGLNDIFGEADSGHSKEPIDSLRQMFRDPSRWGVDWLQDVWVSLENSEDSTHHFAAMYLTLSDQAKLKEMMNQLPADFKTEIRSSEGFEYGLFSKQKMLIGWNQNFALILWATHESSAIHLEKQFLYLAHLPTENQLIKDKNYAQFLETEADLKAWINTKKISQLPTISQQYQMATEKLDGLTHIHLFMSFEKGEILTNSQVFADSHLIQASGKWLNKKVNIPLIERLDYSQLSSYTSLRYEAAWLQEAVERSGFILFLNAYLPVFHLSPSEFYSLFKGDVFLATLDKIKTEEEVITYEYDENFNSVEKREKQIKYAQGFAFGMNSDSVCQRAIENLQTSRVLTKEDNCLLISPMLAKTPTYVSFQDRFLMISTHKDVFSTAAQADHEAKKWALQHPITLYSNFQKIYAETDSVQLKDEEKKWAYSAMQNLDKLFMAVKNVDTSKNFFEIDLKITFTNKEQNAILSLFEWLKKTRFQKTSKPNV
jgi:Domain of unknown function (DUF4836)